jgi:hypothetical protein
MSEEKMKHLIIRAFLFILILSASSTSLLAQTNKVLIELTPQVVLKSFNWGEYNDKSELVLEETGLHYGGGINSKFKFSRSFDLYTKFDFYYCTGLVDYNGFLQDAQGNTEPYKSKTGYEDIETSLNFGYDLYIARQFIIAPEFGFQYEYWIRDIDNGGKYGYDEIYDMLSIKFGSNFIFPLGKSSGIFLNIFGKYPLLIEESIDLASRGQGGPADINLEPGANLGLNVELGANIYGAFISLYYDYMLFSKSGYDQGYFQPESDRSLVGLKIGYTFVLL